MKHVLNCLVFCVVSSLCLALFISGAACFAEDKTDVESLYAEIVGDYEFESGGRVFTMLVVVRDGVLLAKGGDDDEAVPLTPVEGKELEFEVKSDDEHSMKFTFSRNASGKINNCLLVVAGMEFKYTRRPGKSG